MAYKGKFKPKNPHKYKGDPTGIWYRSLWELKVFRRCDERPEIIEWQSEEIAIPYLNPIKKNKDGSHKTSRYFPDLVIKKRVGKNQYQVIMIEIKPKKQTKPPNPANKNKTPTGRVSTRYLREAATYEVNKAKWIAAERYCKERGWAFAIFTEDEIKPLGK